VRNIFAGSHTEHHWGCFKPSAKGMNPYTKLFEIDENAIEFGTLFKSQVKRELLLFFYSHVSTSVGWI
jgi:hypothetical protein